MKLNTQTRNVQSNMGNTKQFNIKTSAKAFMILSDLYGDKLFAIMRELGTNAFDAHVAVGREDRAFKLHLPTQIESWFAIRDFGPGMSEEEVMSLYTTYFDSSKTESNDFVGALGLGSKSPFSYTDNFTVESYQHGIKKTYLANIDQDNTPVISMVGVETTTEEDGLKVQFPVPERDHYQFRYKAPDVYKAFRVQPEINVSSEVFMESIHDKIDADDTAIRGELTDGIKYVLTKGSAFYGTMVLQGNILYPLDLDKLDEEFSEKENTTLIHIRGNRFYGSSRQLLFEVPIGTVDVTPSREALSYSTFTKSNLVKIVREFIANYNDRVIDNAKAKGTLVESLKTYSAMVMTDDKKEVESFLEGELRDRGMTSQPWSATLTDFMPDFVFRPNHHKVTIAPRILKIKRKTNCRGEITSQEIIPVHKFRVGDFPVYKNHYVIYVKEADAGMDRDKILYRIKRHIKSNEGSLPSDRDWYVVFSKRVLKWLGIADYYEFDSNIADIKQLRKKVVRTTANGTTVRSGGTPRYKIHAAPFDHSTDKLDYKTLVSTLKANKGNLGELMFVTYVTFRASYKRDFWAEATTCRSLPKMLQSILKNSPADVKTITGMDVTIVEVDKAELKTKRFVEKMPFSTCDLETLDELLEDGFRAWVKNSDYLKRQVAVDGPQLNRSLVKIARAFIEEKGIEATAEDSPIRTATQTAKLPTEVSGSDVEQKVAALINRYHPYGDAMSEIIKESFTQADPDEHFLSRYPLLHRIGTWNISSIQDSAIEYMELIEAKKIAEENIVAVA